MVAANRARDAALTARATSAGSRCRASREARALALARRWTAGTGSIARGIVVARERITEAKPPTCVGLPRPVPGSVGIIEAPTTSTIASLESSRVMDSVAIDPEPTEVERALDRVHHGVDDAVVREKADRRADVVSYPVVGSDAPIRQILTILLSSFLDPVGDVVALKRCRERESGARFGAGPRDEAGPATGTSHWAWTTADWRNGRPAASRRNGFSPAGQADSAVGTYQERHVVAHPNDSARLSLSIHEDAAARVAHRAGFVPELHELAQLATADRVVPIERSREWVRIDPRVGVEVVEKQNVPLPLIASPDERAVGTK